MYELTVEETFDAAHALRGYEGPCENLHGHTWKVQVQIQGEQLNDIGLLEDFKNVKKALRDVLAKFDHNLINDLPEFQKQNPSSENIAKTVYTQMKSKFEGVSKVSIWESATSCASYWG